MALSSSIEGAVGTSLSFLSAIDEVRILFIGPLDAAAVLDTEELSPLTFRGPFLLFLFGVAMSVASQG